ncbi:hydroxyacylglutathione hydrolase [Thalassotalea sp. PP2-459]|uniref:hydroxyacylglutathione hydrolase n=1 Tax=Thalassotalea sp. PP2-459 TaxID=1742724 RepID=UPI0009420E0E|nr:hydroxyacylglutathione hydrolase [Thalassotalea sp. PP2-459]OKY26579.1 hydroxyacylglutathione hydrolase [Thalassotalea sp. PP2-459]
MSQLQQPVSIQVNAIKAFTDNYIWALFVPGFSKAVLVDPGDASVCIDFIEKNNLQLDAILITHHHPDHVGGVSELNQYCINKEWSIDIFGPKHKDIPCVTTFVEDTDIIEIPSLSLTLTVMTLPGHTLEHVAYYDNKKLFCGDTLFSAGCGRLFEGSPAQMLDSLHKLITLPENTAVYCTHEYTLANVNFALTIEPSNLALVNYYNKVVQLRKNNQITLPSTIKQELAVNPFLRCNEPEVQQSAVEHSQIQNKDELSVFTAIRAWKDNF